MKAVSISFIVSFLYIHAAIKSPYAEENQNEDGPSEDGDIIEIEVDPFNAGGFLSIGDLMQLNQKFAKNGPRGDIPPMGPMIISTDNSEYVEQPIIEEHYTFTDGVNTFEVTEIHIGNKRNLNRNVGSPLPMMLFRNIDDVFDNLFKEIAGSIIAEGIGHNDTAEYNEDDDYNITAITENDLKLDNEEEKEVLTEVDVEKEKEKAKVEERILETKEENVPSTELVESTIPKGPNVKDMIMNSRQKKKQIKDMKKKETFAKICKYVFYSLFFFGLYVVMKKILMLLGLVEESKEKIENVKEGIEMKANCVKNE